MFHVLILQTLFITLFWIYFESHSPPENIVAQRTLLWVDAQSNMCCESWQCNIAIEAAASRFRTVSHTRLERHNCPCPSYTAQNPRKTNTTVCEVPGLVRASEMRVNGSAWLYYVVSYVHTSARIALRLQSYEHAEKLDLLFPDKANWNHEFGITQWKGGSFIVFNKSSLFARLNANTLTVYDGLACKIY